MTQKNTEGSFTEDQIAMLQRAIDPGLVSERQGSGTNMLKHIEGHTAIDQANLIFGFGNWGYRPLSCELVVIADPLTGEAVGVTYKAQVELTVNGCLPIVEVGSHPVVSWNVDDVIWAKRQADAKYKNKPLDESEFKSFERSKARQTIIDAHEMAEKSAVTDGLKRALRSFGNQFGNSLYGKPKAARLSLRQVKDAAMAAGKATDKESWQAFVFSVTGEALTDLQFTQIHLKKLLDAANNKAA